MLKWAEVPGQSLPYKWGLSRKPWGETVHASWGVWSPGPSKANRNREAGVGDADEGIFAIQYGQSSVPSGIWAYVV